MLLPLLSFCLSLEHFERSPQNSSRNAFSSASPSGRARYRRLVPLRRSVTSPASFRTLRCCETAGRVTSKCEAISPAESSSSQTSRGIRRRCGAAIPLRAASTREKINPRLNAGVEVAVRVSPKLKTSILVTLLALVATSAAGGLPGRPVDRLLGRPAAWHGKGDRRRNELAGRRRAACLAAGLGLRS
jgi:hypothetical protein